MIVDTEDMNRKRAPALAELAELSRSPGERGALARLGLATAGIDDWVADEFRRGTSRGTIAVAVMKRAAALVATQLGSLGSGANPEVAMARRGLIELFELQLHQSLAMIDAMSPDQREANTLSIHQAQ